MVCYSALGMHYLCNKSNTYFLFSSNAQNSKWPKYVSSTNTSVWPALGGNNLFLSTGSICVQVRACSLRICLKSSLTEFLSLNRKVAYLSSVSHFKVWHCSVSVLLLNQTWVRRQIYWHQVVVKERAGFTAGRQARSPGLLVLKTPELPSGFQEGILKVRWGKGVPGYVISLYTALWLIIW